ncbi:methyl-accepting chemotaxis protein [Singulisphaera acidiphila]|uniref:Methyl-accepting chemotaxis protein n=1 Tax=Singulisphaera acidiphila (strain ATCC BAA-1392 / DSM 18658 / VKM B-2454 / MOB10) TaxID=886293 RepID=L0DHY3_SINAD|nr:methyl-accepting chemotaxis protein [Singulisphaera acidiphila]AGA28994.1 methyl-accepting chemotaxis protein [Singulisphaera acidiphila DSM 18658]
MNLRLPSLASANIASRLLFWFLAIALVPSIILTVVTAYLSRRSVEISVHDRLMVIADAKTTQLENFIRERRGDVAVLGQAPAVVTAVARLSELAKTGKRATDEYRREADAIRAGLGVFAHAYNYPNIYIFDIEGTPLASYQRGFDTGTNLLTGPMKGTEFADAFVRARTLLQAVMSNYQLYPGRSQPSAFVAGPVMQNGISVGVAVVELGNAQVFRVFDDYSGLGETGETIVAMRTGEELTFVAPTRFDRTSAFRLKIPIGGALSESMQLAVRGKRGYGEGLDYRGSPVIAAWSYLPSYRWGMVVKQDVGEAFELIRQQRIVVVILLSLTVVAVGLVAILVARSLSRPIREAADAANRVAAGDLSVQIKTRATGEAGQLLTAVKKMTLDLKTLIGKIQKSSIALMSTATEIAATSRQQQETVNEYGASTSEAAAAAKQISATSQELLRTMNEVNNVAAQTAQMATEGQGSLSNMGRSMRSLADSTGSISSKLSVISERAANINLVVTTITKVADQTNLLSINAAIEAEKAGEYGLGFLVVAREIRRLADMTAVATLDIERMVKEMQYSVSAGVMEMDKFTDQVRQGVGEVAHIGEQLGLIITDVQGLTGRFEQVTEGMRVQSQGAEQIREAVVRLSDGAHQTSVSLREFNKATDHLREAISELKEEVSRFTLDQAEPGTFPGS